MRQWHFRVFLDHRLVGYDRISVREHGDERDVESEAQLDVRVLSILVFHYRYHASERWRDGCVEHLDAVTDDNGKAGRVVAESNGNGLTVVSARGRESLAGCVMTYAYWDPRLVSATRLLNTQTGEYQHVRITTLPDQSIRVRGAPALARHYRLDTGRHDIDLWYSRNGDWLGLESTVALGRRLRYQLQ